MTYKFNSTKFLWALNLALSMSLVAMESHRQNWILVVIFSIFALYEIAVLSFEKKGEK